MGTKLAKSTYPSGHSPDDFECYGPIAVKDGEFEQAMLAELGCFNQSGVDSNKYYVAEVCRSKKTDRWFAYFEWGRTGATNPSFQFVECSSKDDAHSEFVAQVRSKNDKRGEWVTIAGIRTLRAKAGKDCYLVRPMAQRSTGLPDGRKIVQNDGAKPKPQAAPTTKKAASGPKVDAQTVSLMRDLSVATVSYAKQSIVGNAIPSQAAIDEARLFLTEAQKRLLVVGDNENNQVNDSELKTLTSLIYGRIPKVKPVGAPPSTWVLSKNNILQWQQDLDAFESALNTNLSAVEAAQPDVFAGMPIKYMEWVDPKSSFGTFLYSWWPKATKNRHGGVGSMVIKNAWRFEREGDFDRLAQAQQAVTKQGIRGAEKPLHQPDRIDLESAQQTLAKNSNTALMFHGTRTVNVKGILNKSLLLPKQLVGVMITGAMFGPGLYFADDWKKSDGYTSRYGSYWSSGGGAVKGRAAFMFAADVVCGEPHVASGPHGYTQPPRGHHCVFGKAGHSQVQNNEWIVFNKINGEDHQQSALRYLIEYDCK
jgi:hypothetical protein